MNKAVFLDRDGVVNRELGHYCENISDFEILEDVGSAIRILKDAGFLVIVISNQGGIAKGLYTEADVMAMHTKLSDYLSKFDTSIDDFYFCPHHDSKSKCLCRKPQSLLIEKAMATYNINPALSYMIGDGKRDIEAAESANVKGILIEPNSGILEICKQIASE
ncbi:MAG: HAD family hydrolase [Bacteroidales bacterium]|jgi:D-glycero-D-manno-heptose 1,7-bisphosphate phosphatase|nr:HAD family hydrolase [Bacteroidales bacterium]